jgi:hypothetical protein
LLGEDAVVCEPMTVYGAAKLIGEYYAKAYRRTYGMDTVVVRPFNAYGPGAHERGDLAEVLPRFFIRVLNGLPPVIFGDPGNGRDFTYVTEVARGIAAAGECDALVGEVVNIAYGKLFTVGEVAETVLRVCRRPDLRPLTGPHRPAPSRRRAHPPGRYRQGQAGAELQGLHRLRAGRGDVSRLVHSPPSRSLNPAGGGDGKLGHAQLTGKAPMEPIAFSRPYTFEEEARAAAEVIASQ